MRHVRGKLFAGALIAAATLAFSMSGERYTMVTGRDVLSIDLATLAPGSGRKYAYADDAGHKLRFLLARGQDGQVRSVFDVCRECYSYHKGYAISGNELICRVCGNRYPIDRMTTGKASCVPVALAHREDRGTAKIRVADVIAGRSMF
jgi:uncharacterized membrane protein